MNKDEIQTAVVTALRRVAPEADASSLDPKADIREALDIDSMDFLSFVTALHKGLGVDVPERDYAKIRTLEACVAYLAERVA
jgi:acyl carrier protein